MARKRDKESETRKSREKPVSRPFAMPCKGWQAAVACAVVAAAAIVAYHNSLGGELFYDNLGVIVNNEILKGENNTGKIFSSNYWEPRPSDLYRPLTIYTYYVNYKIWGWEAKPLGYHICNLFLHVVNGLLVFLLVSRISGRALIGASAALLFVTHPITTEAVTNVVGRADLLAMLFVLIAFLLHMAGSVSAKPRRRYYFVLGAFSLFLGLLSKENAIAGIAVFAAFDVILLWPKIRAQVGDVRLWRWFARRLYTCYVFYVVIIAGWFLIRSLVFSAEDPSVVNVVPFFLNPLAYAPFLQREATAIVVLGLYFWRLIWPVTLSADYSYNQIPMVTSPANAAFTASLAAVLAALVLGVFLWKRSPVAAFFIWFFFICITPVSNIFVVTGTIGAERLLYMPSLAWSGLLAMGLAWLCGKLGRRQLAVVAVACIVGLYGYRTIVRNFDWQEMSTFWRATAKASPQSVIALGNYAGTLVRDNPQEALKCLKKAAEIDDRYIGNYTFYGGACMEWGWAVMAEGPKNSERTREALKIFVDCYNQIERWLNRDNYIVDEMKRRVSAKGGDVSLFAPAGLLEVRMNQATLAADIAAMCPEGGEMYTHYNNETIRQAKMAAFLTETDPEPNCVMAEALMRNAERLSTSDPRRQKLLDQAATACMRTILMSRDKSARVFGLLGLSYQAMGLDPDKLLIEPKKGGNFQFAPGEKINDKYMRLGARSQVMIDLATGRKNEVSAVEKAAIRLGVRAADLEPLRAQSFSRDDENIWVGE